MSEASSVRHSPYRTAGAPPVARFELRTGSSQVVIAAVVAALGIGMTSLILWGLVNWRGAGAPQFILLLLSVSFAVIGVAGLRGTLPRGSALRIFEDRVELPRGFPPVLELDAITASQFVEKLRGAVILGFIPIPIMNDYVSLRLDRRGGPPVIIPAGMFRSPDACAEAVACIRRLQGLPVADEVSTRRAAEDAKEVSELITALEGEVSRRPSEESKRRTCAACAASNSGDSVFCKRCGRSLEPEP